MKKKKAKKTVAKRKKRKKVTSYRPMCSGWEVFPDGQKCKGCPDCGHEKNNNDLIKR